MTLIRRHRVAAALAAVLVVLVLAAAGYLWAQLHSLTAAVATADVIDPGAAGRGGQNILVIGLDSRTDARGDPLPQPVLDALHAGAGGAGGDLTDTMIVVHVRTGAGSPTAISLPRDSYVDIPGFGTHKLNSAYARGTADAAASLRAQGVSGPQLATRSAQGGARTAIAAVERLTGLTVTHYAAVDLAGFVAISNAIGGVPVCLNAAVDDPFSGAHLPAGPQTVEGAQALAFVRQRHGLPHGDLDRIRRQQAFLAGLSRTVVSGATLTDPARLGAVLGAIRNSVTLDSGSDPLTLARELGALGRGPLTFHTIPVGTTALPTPADGTAVQVDPAQVRAFVRRLTTPATATPADPHPVLAPASSTAPGANPAGPPIPASGQACIN